METSSQVESVATGSKDSSKRLNEIREIDELFSAGNDDNSANNRTQDEEG